jgi:DeoR/GlpR family transcriptional regulator of sugar metabolism
MLQLEFLVDYNPKIEQLNPMQYSKKPGRLPAAARRRAIREELAKESSITISDIAGRLGVSEMTIRRDLEKLEKDAQVRRTRGGAVLRERMVFEFKYQDRQRAHLAEKKAIAQKARELIKPGDRILIDTGSTALQFAATLKDCTDLTIITPSLAVASEVQFCEGIQVILLGGVLHHGSPDLTGPVTEHCLELFSADWLFQGAEGVGWDGCVYNTDLQLGQVDRKMRQRAEKVCLLADSSKIGKTALVETGNLSEFNFFITDEKADSDFIERMRKLGITIQSVAPLHL